MTQLTCPTCRRLFDMQQTAAMPFCSERCRLIDLHRWLTETNSLPIERDGEEDPANNDGAEIPKHEGMTNDE